MGEVSSEFVNWLIWALGLAGTFYATAYIIDDNLERGKKESLSLWLMGSVKDTWTQQFCAWFDGLFGEKRLSLRFVLRSALASFVAVFLLWFLFAKVFGVLDQRMLGDLPLWQALVMGAVINLIPDYLSLCETRWLLGRFEKVQSVAGQILILIVDLVVSAAIIWGGLTLFLWARGEAAPGPVEVMALFSIFAVFFYSTFLTSVWAWMYCLSTWLMRLFSGWKLADWLSVEQQPVKAVGVLGGVLIILGGAAIAALPARESGEAFALDEALCEQFGGNLCMHSARLNKDDNRLLAQIEEFCGTSDVETCYPQVVAFMRSDEAAYGLWRRGCVAGRPSACTSLGYMHRDGLGVAQDEARAVDLYRQGCDGGNANGCTHLGWMYRNGLGVAQDYARAVDLYRQGCDGGSAIGCANLGVMYEHGRGVAQDDARAVDLYRQGCDGGHANGCTSLANMYYFARGLAQDYARAVALYGQGCDGGSARGCTNLGTMHEDGKGVETSMASANALYKQGCDGGSAGGCSYLGDMYENAKGVEIDLTRALELYKRGCDGGHAWGCEQLQRASAKQD